MERWNSKGERKVGEVYILKKINVKTQLYENWKAKKKKKKTKAKMAHTKH